MAATGQEEFQLLKHRLLTQTTVTKGDPPFKKIQKRFLQFCEAARQRNDNVDELYTAVVRELTLIQFQVGVLCMSKSIFGCAY